MIEIGDSKSYIGWLFHGWLFYCSIVLAESMALVRNIKLLLNFVTITQDVTKK